MQAMTTAAPAVAAAGGKATSTMTETAMETIEAAGLPLLPPPPPSPSPRTTTTSHQRPATTYHSAPKEEELPNKVAVALVICRGSITMTTGMVIAVIRNAEHRLAFIITVPTAGNGKTE